MKGAGIAIGILAAVSTAAVAEMGKTRRVGPWNVGAFTEKGQFQHCIMARPEKGGTPGFGLAKGRSYLTLAIFSSKWKLDPGSTYPVTLVAGGVSEELQAKVDSATAVGVALGGREALVSALFSASVLEVRTPASTLRLPMDRSSAALRTLNECFEVESQVAANPFGPSGAPTAKPDNPFASTSPAPAAPPPPQQAAAPPPVAPAVPATQPDAAYLKLRADCEQDSDADRQIAGCTAVIDSPREAREVKGIALANRAFGYSNKSENEKALASFNQAIEFYPGYANARWGRADFHAARGDWDAAIADYDAALKIDPKDDYSQKRRAEAEAKRAAALAARNPPAPVVAPPSPAELLQRRREEAIEAIETVGIAPQTCGYSPVLGTIATLATTSELSPEMLEAGPFAEIRRARAQRLLGEAQADKAAFCARVIAAYGESGRSVPNLLVR